MSDTGFDSDDDFDLEGFDNEFGDLDNKGTLGDLWRNNPLVKIGVILFAIALIVGVIILFTGDKEVKDRSVVSRGSDITAVPGTEAVTENYRQAIEETNTTRLEEALRQNESAIPMPVEAPKGVIPLALDEPEEVDPLERWRKLQQDKVERASKKAPVVVEEEPEVDTRTPAIQALSEAMASQMESILGNQEIPESATLQIADLGYLESLQEAYDEKLEEERQEREDALENGFLGGRDNGRGGRADILLPAGTIEYAQLITEANTDVPGPILAEIMTGPFKGGRLIGTFEETYNYLTLSFNTIVLDGIDYSAEAVAIDPDTTLPGLATDINRRYFRRVLLPVAAKFITGYADAIAESGRTTITISGDTVTETTQNDNSDDQEVASGIASAGEELGDILNEIQSNYPQLIRVRSGTPMGIFFVNAVTDNQNEDDDLIGPYRAIDDRGLVDGVPASSTNANSSVRATVN